MSTFQKLNTVPENVWNDLLREGLCGSLSGEPFSTIHGDLITEVAITGEVKVRGDTITGGHSTSDKTNDVFIKTSHAMVKVRSNLKK